MTHGQPVSAPRRIREPHGARPAEDLSDRQLLQRFVRRREQAAFETLVRRHGARVLAVCRRVLRNEHDAEDVSQAAFLLLARKAGLIPWRESVAGWLAVVASRLALHARSTAARRLDRERPAASLPAARDSELEQEGNWSWLPEQDHPQEDPLAEVARRELRLVLDDELDRLPEKYRAPVVLCYLEGKTNAEAADELGWPTGSMSRRLARARALLQERLTRRGLAFGTVLFCLVLTAFWLLRPGRPAVPDSQPAPVARAMTPFKPAAQGGHGIESVLLRLAAGGKPDAEPLTRLAQRTVAVSAWLQGHDPGRRQKDWHNLADDMRRSAHDLARASLAKEDEGIVLAARRLNATCQKCHEIFRD
jgi:RNA polymerase sigma-70 factor (ECF subfamily)